jgi:hypothetical protein
MLIKKNLALILLLIFTFAIVANADIAPPKGYTKVSINLVIETKQDLSDYRFFVDFYGDLNEITVKNNGRVSIPPIGGGARYSTGTVYAIPKKSIESTPKDADREQFSNLSESLREDKIEGAIKLGEHSFYNTVLNKNIKKVVTPTYLIEKKNNTLIMSVKKAMKKVEFEAEDESVESDSNKLIGGVFLSMFMLFGGIFLFRKKS